MPSVLARVRNSKLLGGSLTLLAGSGLVSVANLLYNVGTARLLGASGFAHATTVYTLLMLMSAITLSFQVVCAKYVARAESAEEKAEVFATLHQRSWIAGIGIGILIFAGERALTTYLNLPDKILVSLLALGTAFYIPLGARRGYIQGVYAFGALALNLLIEGVARVAGLFLLIALGLGVKGAVLASVVAVILSYFLVSPSPRGPSFRLRGTTIPFLEGLQAIVFFSGQTVINNFDIVLVKHFFVSDEAGIYAAVSLVGRLVYMCAWSVVNTMFPLSAAAKGKEAEGDGVLFTSLSLVAGILTVLIGGLWLLPTFVWKLLFGTHFERGNYGDLASLLILYAVTTAIYSFSSVMITYEMSRKIANTSWVQLAFSGALTLGMYAFHNSLKQVIVVRLLLMIALLATLTVPLLRKRFAPQLLGSYSSIRVRRPLSEEEVIAEFLRSEFHHTEFQEYRDEFSHLVNNPDLNSPRENALRRALLFLRRGPMWRELPTDTKWFEVELTSADLDRVRFFPRAQWRRVAQGNFQLNEVVGRIRERLEVSSDDRFFNKLRALSLSVQGNLMNPTVLLIGIDEKRPLTILDGNHRMAAALLCGPGKTFAKMHFICGFSANMTHCCWYDTNVNTILRYLKNLLRYLIYDPESEIGRFQESDL